MKLFQIICLCLFASFAFGQGKLSPQAKKKLKAQRIYATKYNKGEFNVYRIDSIPRDGILIDNGWKIKYEDKKDFSNSDLDDSKWDTTDIDKPFNEFNFIEKNRIGWFRKKISIDSSLVGKPYILNILITGAAEIFLNGKLIHEIGKVSLDPQKAKTKNFKIKLPYSIVFNSYGEQVISIRFLFAPQRKIDKYHDDFYPLSIRIVKLEGLVEKILTKETNNTLSSGVCAGLFFMMAFIHFFFHQYFRSKKYNRSLSIAMILFGVYSCFWRTSYVNNDFQMLVNIRIVKSIILIIANIVLFNSIYEFLQYPKKILFWIIITMFTLLNVLVFFQKIPSYYIAVAYGLLIFNYIFLIWKSIKNKTPSGVVMRNAVIIFISIFVSFLIFLIVYFAIYNGSSASDHDILNTVVLPVFLVLFFVGPQLSVSGAISFSLAKEFVDTNISLSQKLEEIEKLSEEKQHILSTQNEYLEKQVTQRTAELNQSLENLKITQNQLIQSEKLASLGELTAGIAHEIQNPLNFVNNFSELSVELIEELQEERNKETGERDNELERELLSDISQNLEKITHHGKRASSIVKGMLEHSRLSSNVKELTDINALADEYLRLSYHGLRAKDKTFNANLKTDFDENIEKVNIVSQDIGRVILNLITNAFYAVNEKKKSNPYGYEPTVSVSSKKVNDKIELKIKDNGNGIPERVLDKIFQPFFTTKPTGQGTGLGLSLSYDIVKAHGGELKVETSEGEFTEFTIILPQKTA
jgi:two-component system, NtrC family, sensor kinase